MELDVFSMMTPVSTGTNENTAYSNNDPLCKYLLGVERNEEKFDMENYKKLLLDWSEKNKDNETRDPTALFIASGAKQVGPEVIKMLLDAGCHVNACREKDNQTPLIAAIMSKDISKVNLLIDRGADVNQVCNLGNPLHVAVHERNSVEMIELLLRKGADVNQECVNERDYWATPLLLAMNNNSSEIFEYLLAQTIQPLLLKPPHPNYYKNPPLASVVSAYVVDYLYNLSEAEYDYIWKLLLAGVDVNARDSENLTALTIALQTPTLKIATLLLERGAMANDVGPGEKDDVWYACQAEFPDVLATLLERGGNAKKIYKGGLTALAAVLKDSSHPDNLPYEDMIKIISILHEEGVDINLPFVDEQTGQIEIPIAKAPTLQVFKAMHLLCGADLTLRVKGQNLLHRLVENKKPDALKYVLSLNVLPVNEKDDQGKTPLQLALQNNTANSDSSKLISLLLKHGAEIDTLDNDNRSPLFYSFQIYDYEPALALLKAGASVRQVDIHGENVLHFIARQATQQQQHFHTLVQHASKEQIQTLIRMPNNKGKTPVAYCINEIPSSESPLDFVQRQRQIGFRALLKGDLYTAIKNGIDVLKFEKLEKDEIEKLTRGFYLESFAQFDSNNSFDGNLSFDSITVLSQDVMLLIMKLLDVATVVALSSTCRQFMQWNNETTLWRYLFTLEFGHDDTCQHFKQELAKRWNAQVNMRKGKYYVKNLSMVPSCVWPKYDPSADKATVGYNATTNIIVAMAPYSTTVFKDDVLIKEFSYSTDIARERFHLAVDENKIIQGGYSGLHVFDLETGEKTMVDPETGFQMISVSGDLVACKLMHRIEIFNWTSREKICLIPNQGDTKILLVKNILIVSSQQTIRFWELTHRYDDSTKKQNTIATWLADNTDDRVVVPKLYSVNETCIFAASDVPELIDIRTSKTIWRASSIGPIRHVAIDTKAGIIVTTTGTTIVAWSLHNGAKKGVFSVYPHNSSRCDITAVAVAGSLIFVATSDKGIDVFSINNNRLENTIITGELCTSMVIHDHRLILGLTNKLVAIVNFDVKSGLEKE